MVHSFAVLSAYLLTPTLGGLSENPLDYVKLAYAASYNSYKANAYKPEEKVPNAPLPGKSCGLVWTEQVKNTKSSKASAGAFMRSFSNEDVTVLAFRGTDEHAGFDNDWTNYNLNLHEDGLAPEIEGDRLVFPSFKKVIRNLRKSRRGAFRGFSDYVRNSGFQKWLQEMDEKINTNQQHKIIITGHSLGAAAAYIAATQLEHLQKNLVAVVPFASPFPGGQPFVDEYNGLGLCSKTVSFVNSLDFIPTVPWGGRSPCEHKVQKLHTFRGSIVHHFLEEDYKPELEVYLQKLGKNDECAFQRPGIF
jgi:hypothetical protein